MISVLDVTAYYNNKLEFYLKKTKKKNLMTDLDFGWQDASVQSAHTSE